MTWMNDFINFLTGNGLFFFLYLANIACGLLWISFVLAFLLTILDRVKAKHRIQRERKFIRYWNGILQKTMDGEEKQVLRNTLHPLYIPIKKKIKHIVRMQRISGRQMKHYLKRIFQTTIPFLLLLFGMFYSFDQTISKHEQIVMEQSNGEYVRIGDFASEDGKIDGKVEESEKYQFKKIILTDKNEFAKYTYYVNKDMHIHAEGRDMIFPDLLINMAVVLWILLLMALRYLRQMF